MGVGVKNFKKRWFKLTNHELSYAKCKGGYLYVYYMLYMQATTVIPEMYGSL